MICDDMIWILWEVEVNMNELWNLVFGFDLFFSFWPFFHFQLFSARKMLFNPNPSWRGQINRCNLFIDSNRGNSPILPCVFFCNKIEFFFEKSCPALFLWLCTLSLWYSLSNHLVVIQTCCIVRDVAQFDPQNLSPNYQQNFNNYQSWGQSYTNCEGQIYY